MSKISPLSGFPELLPAQRVVEREVIASLSRTFELHGFANIETRVVEPIDRLAKGGEIDKEIYVLQRLAAEPDARAELGLHFDLTVPFARYVLEHAGHLEFPFRRFQIQPAWRGERPQEGRYRQFTQADVDIVGRDDLPFHHDVEVMSVMVDALGRLPIPPRLVPVQQPQAHPGLLPRAGHRRRHRGDPRHRQARQAARRRGRPPARRARRRDPGAGRSSCLDLATIRVGDTSFVERVRALGVSDELLDQGLDELSAVVEGCAAVAGDRVTRRGQPAHRPRPRLLHRHRRRDLHERLRAAQVRRWRRSLRRARQRRPYDLPRRRRVVRRLAHPRPAHRRRRPRGQPPGAQRRARRGERRGRSARPAPRSPTRCGPGKSLARSHPQPPSSASRSGSPNAAASPTSGSSRTTAPTRSRTSAPGSRSTQIRRPGPHPGNDLHPQVISKEQDQ